MKCPACGSEEFRLVRNDRHMDAGIDVYCAGCENATAEVIAKTLDQRLQRDRGQLGLDEVDR